MYWSQRLIWPPGSRSGTGVTSQRIQTRSGLGHPGIFPPPGDPDLFGNLPDSGLEDGFIPLQVTGDQGVVAVFETGVEPPEYDQVVGLQQEDIAGSGCA
ncbi:MAG: hypothetical protein MUO62_04860 [Anaerolineales bacterium]|nr:hypothetical protein [Anaerolineales bacterium]